MKDRLSEDFLKHEGAYMKITSVFKMQNGGYMLKYSLKEEKLVVGL